MTTIDVDGLLEPVRTAPSEGEALKRLLAANEIALRSIRMMLGGVDGKERVEELMKEIDRLLADMTLSSQKVEATMRDPRSKMPIMPPPPEKPAAEQKAKPA